MRPQWPPRRGDSCRWCAGRSSALGADAHGDARCMQPRRVGIGRIIGIVIVRRHVQRPADKHRHSGLLERAGHLPGLDTPRDHRLELQAPWRAPGRRESRCDCSPGRPRASGPWHRGQAHSDAGQRAAERRLLTGPGQRPRRTAGPFENARGSSRSALCVEPAGRRHPPPAPCPGPGPRRGRSGSRAMYMGMVTSSAAGSATTSSRGTHPRRLITHPWPEISPPVGWT